MPPKTTETPSKAVAKRGSTALAKQDERLETIRNIYLPDGTPEELQLCLYHEQKTGLDVLSRQLYPIRLDGKLSFQISIDGFRLIAERTDKYGGQLGPWWTIGDPCPACDGVGVIETSICPRCHGDGLRWMTAWIENGNPKAAKIGIVRTDWKEPVYVVATWDAYAQMQEAALCPHCGADAIIRGREEYGGGWLCFKKKGGCGAKFEQRPPGTGELRLVGWWAKGGAHQLAKCAEALGLRKAFPQELSGYYSVEEMEQSTSPTPITPESVSEPKPATPPKKDPPPKKQAAPRSKTPPQAEPPPPKKKTPPQRQSPDELLTLGDFRALPLEGALLTDVMKGQIAQAFNRLGIEMYHLENLIGRDVAQWTESIKEHLLDAYLQIVDGKREAETLQVMNAPDADQGASVPEGGEFYAGDEEPPFNE